MHFARSIVLGHHSIPKINWDHLGVGIISGAVRSHENDIHSPFRLVLTL